MTIQTPEFYFHVPGHQAHVTQASALWRMDLLPGSRDAGDAAFDSPSIGDYFSAAREFIADNAFHFLTRGLAEITGETVASNDIRRIGISLVKHGACYHPSRVDVTTASGRSASFALNGAVSTQGKKLIAGEFRNLERLAASIFPPITPKVFGLSKTAHKPPETLDRSDILFFLAEWFDGFNEFHITRTGSGYEVAVWEADGTTTLIPPPDYFDIYGNIAEILTRLYDWETFEQVFPWHHAAGDFVLGKTGESKALRLITVRGYGALMETGTGHDRPEPEEISSALLFFLVNLSLRIRIDRINGTGDYHFIDEGCLGPVIRGIFTGFVKKRLPPAVKESFIRLIASMSIEDYLEFCTLITRSYNPDAPEIPLIMTHLDLHAEHLYRHINETVKKSFFIDKGN